MNNNNFSIEIDESDFNQIEDISNSNIGIR